MKLRAETDTVRVEALAEGDRIIASVSHEVKVGGEASWIKWEVNSAVREGEDTETAKTRVKGHVTATVMELVHEVVDSVRKVNG